MKVYMKDITDPRDSFVAPDGDEQEAAGVYIHDLLTAVHNLEQETPFGYAEKLDEAIARLGKLLENVEKPF